MRYLYQMFVCVYVLTFLSCQIQAQNQPDYTKFVNPFIYLKFFQLFTNYNQKCYEKEFT